MRITPLRQSGLIDVATWEQDAEFGTYPQGARAKEAYFSPAEPDGPAITPAKRYLFKRSDKRYPEQFWGEIIAYRIGCLMGLEVPPAFAAWNSATKINAALIEWFYVDGEEASLLAGDYLQNLQPDFDRAKGTQHNLRHISVLLRAFSRGKLIEENSWRQWWVDALLFDALIGNTDRHQDNWGFVFKLSDTPGFPTRFTPLFDNGTSLGHERFPERTAGWTPADFQRYIEKGTHHVSWSLGEPRIKGHRALLATALEAWPETFDTARSRLANVTKATLLDALSDLPHIPCPEPLSPARFAFTLRLLTYRLAYLKEILK